MHFLIKHLNAHIPCIQNIYFIFIKNKRCRLHKIPCFRTKLPIALHKLPVRCQTCHTMISRIADQHRLPVIHNSSGRLNLRCFILPYLIFKRKFFRKEDRFRKFTIILFSIIPGLTQITFWYILCQCIVLRIFFIPLFRRIRFCFCTPRTSGHDKYRQCTQPYPASFLLQFILLLI